ncbi:MAG: hypothetical protein HY912_21710 [Desulfomonile tiedjei]|uniref:Uncharacterized protein n=1 Tax=Desulfomonile tiedjei TaxID=2358 RepID=A0A9D6Z5L7_9BACT|nr:hypothetical protein [Desulfomonile tiedjei]
MGTVLPERVNGQNASLMWLTTGGLCVYCLVLTVITGDIGFEGDDWWILSWPYWHGFPASLFVYAKESLRPMEGVYWIGLFELFGFNKIAFHLFSLILLSAASLLMGSALMRAFPRQKGLAILAALLAFFLPTVSCLTYVVATDNSRLSMLLFWVSAIAFQRWSERSSSWMGLSVPIFLYVPAFLTYEAPTLLIFAVPLLVLPIHLRLRKLSNRDFCIRLGAAVCVAFLLAIAIRFTFLGGGAVGHRHLYPPLELLWSYIALLPFYFTAPFTALSFSLAECLLALGIMGIALVAAFSGKVSLPDDPESVRWVNSRLYLVAVGLTILILGLLPYQLAGYGSVAPKLADTVLAKYGAIPDGNTAWFNFNWSSRIYSAGSFGLAILIAVLATGWKNGTLRLLARISAVAFIGVMVVFHAGLRKDWQDAAQIRNDIMMGLVSQVPEVEPGTNFVLLNLESYHKRAAIFRGWGGLRELVRMLYDDRKVGAWFLYPYCWKSPNNPFQQALVSEKGFVSRGMKLDQPLPHDSLLLMNKVGSSLVMLDRINSHDGIVPTGIHWEGVSSVRSNSRRIVAWSPTGVAPRKYVKNAWETGLISTLHLSRVKLGLKIVNRWTWAFRDRRISARLMKK